MQSEPDSSFEKAAKREAHSKFVSKSNELRVTVDKSFLTIGKGGVARYIICLLEALRACEFPDIHIDTISYPLQNHGFQQPARMLKTVGRELLWQPVIAPILLQRLGTRVFHAPWSACVACPRDVPKIATLHDLAYLKTPERFRRWTRARIPIELEAYRNADFLICPSRSTAEDAMRHLNISSDRIEVVYHGSHFGATTPEQSPAITVPDEFFLFVSSLESGKNLRLLNNAYRMAEQRGKRLPPLVIVGRRVEGVEDEGAPPTSWIYAGRASDEELVWLYRRAIALVYPSKFEGFGFPILEAMALGTAVICSPVSSLPEVGGDVPLYAEQTETSYLDAMLQIINRSDERADRIRSGKERAKMFSWASCAEATAEVYRQVASRRA